MFTAAILVVTVSTAAVAAGFGEARSRTVAAALVVLQTPSLLLLAPHLPVPEAGLLGLHALVAVYIVSIVWARPRPRWFWWLVTQPAAWFSVGAILAVPWALITLVGYPPPTPWLPWLLSGWGLLQSLVPRRSVVAVPLDGRDLGAQVARMRPGSTSPASRPLRIVQITDPHLGPFMSASRLQRICRRALAAEPDLILLTGDFLTMETNAAPDMLAEGLAPLRQAAGRVFACRGNHDLEAPEAVQHGLGAASVRLLVDELARVDTPAGSVEILGIDYRSHGRAEHIAAVCSQHPRSPSALRLVLLHDPSAFSLIPPGQTDLVLAGHTHGGQIGLWSLGAPWTLGRALFAMPDHGLWSRGTDRLYVHRGTGHYGFPLRVGVPAEESVLELDPAANPTWRQTR